MSRFVYLLVICLHMNYHSSTSNTTKHYCMSKYKLVGIQSLYRVYSTKYYLNANVIKTLKIQKKIHLRNSTSFTYIGVKMYSINTGELKAIV